jgi:hypothetical protein
MEKTRMKSIAKRLTIALICVAAASLFQCRTASAQLPRPTYFSLENNNSHLCLSLPGPARLDYPDYGLQLTQEPCDGRQGEIWSQGDPTASGGINIQPYTLASDYYCCSLYVAGVQARVMQDATPVIMWSEDPTNYGVPGAVNNQGWALIQEQLTLPPDPNDPPCYLIANAGGEPTENGQQGLFVMGVAYASTAPGASIVIWDLLDDQDGPDLPNSDQFWCAIPPGPPNPLT